MLDRFFNFTMYYLLFYIFSYASCSHTVPDLSSDSVNISDSSTEPAKYGHFPFTWDWRDRAGVSPVKNQRGCDACWAFSAVANIESHLRIHRGIEEELSEQFLIDCDSRGIGCGSGSVLKTFGEIVSNLGGVLRYSDYKPYSNHKHSCAWRGLPMPIPVTGFKRVRSDEEEMAMALVVHGPLSAGINSESMKVYKGGLDDPTDHQCDPTQLDHAVLIVGYTLLHDHRNGRMTPCWIIKNSWGVEWGHSGYYFLVRGRNACGIANDVSFVMVN